MIGNIRHDLLQKAHAFVSFRGMTPIVGFFTIPAEISAAKDRYGRKHGNARFRHA